MIDPSKPFYNRGAWIGPLLVQDILFSDKDTGTPIYRVENSRSGKVYHIPQGMLINYSQQLVWGLHPHLLPDPYP